MLRKIRILLSFLFFLLVMLLFFECTSSSAPLWSWVAKVQLIPAIVALNIGVLVGIVVMTLLMGRIYCSVVCPLGVLQDIISSLAVRIKKRRFFYRPAVTWLRWSILILFVLAAFFGFIGIAALIAPYSAFGRIASNVFAPVWHGLNNLLALAGQHIDSYVFSVREVHLHNANTLGIAVATLVILTVLAWKYGRLYCNTICPVGTVLGLLARFSLFKPIIRADKCIQCGLCAQRCKASCIQPETHSIDYSRCVDCMNCLENCRFHAIEFSTRRTFDENAIHPEAASKTATQTATTTALTAKEESLVAADGAEKSSSGVHASRRGFFTAATGAVLLGLTDSLQAEEKKPSQFDGGLAEIIEKHSPVRTVPITPPGSDNALRFAQRCTGCQLCVAACPNQVLQPSYELTRLNQPKMAYQHGYCRPECVRCSQVCPTNAIERMTREKKSALHIGYAVWIRDVCVVVTDKVSCGNCERHCPSEAITMIPLEPNEPNSLKIPSIDTQRCLGCGACENLCPARPLSAIYVEGEAQHRKIEKPQEPSEIV